MIKTHTIFQILLISFVITLVSCQNKTEQTTDPVSVSNWQYFGQTSPGSEPHLFSPDIISTRRNERDFAISPAGNEIFYTLVLPDKNHYVILYMYFDGFFWSEPQVAPFSGQYNDLEPAFSPNGKKLFFISNRPLTDGKEKSDYDIWFVDKTMSDWSKPVNIGAPVNTIKSEYYPSVTSDGTLYFTAGYDNSLGAEDIYYSRMEENNYTLPVNAGDSINSSLYEFNAFVAPDESYILFSSFGREDDLGDGDLYISYKINDTLWTKARNLGKTINSDKLDYCPFVTYDNKYLFFTSQRIDPGFKTNYRKNLGVILQLADGIKNGLGNIYWVEFDAQAFR
ncbi:MAG: PD40 domain-containing protein [Bacteroidetes bacterium]|nr:PD40 domain-containing protein [Bacteroidota bacterium]MBL7103102.1 PD40 domain-containing protein [Bacteroidales bacterium]